jgi:hypothetical protein
MWSSTAVPSFAHTLTGSFDLFTSEEETTMTFAGIVVTLIGFLIAAVSPGVMSGTVGRLIMTLAGIAISLFGIMGILNPAFQKHAVWRR